MIVHLENPSLVHPNPLRSTKLLTDPLPVPARRVDHLRTRTLLRYALSRPCRTASGACRDTRCAKFSEL